jgi:uncharacterized membrane protein YdfJ with MMPL/SSD domain
VVFVALGVGAGAVAGTNQGGISAVVFDAVVLRLLVLPAAMTLLGERAWWPRRPDRGTVPSRGDIRARQGTCQG